MPTAEFMNLILREFEQRPEHRQLLDAMVAGLRFQAIWLHLAGQTELADQAALLAQHLPALPLMRNPLLARVIAAGLRAHD